MTADGYDSAYDWCDIEIFDYCDFLDREEMEEYLEENFDHIDNEKFWDHVNELLDGYYE